MPVSEEFRVWVLDQLAAVRPVRTRRMFGGIGVYADDLFFALMDDDVVYFKVDDATRIDFEAAGSHPFRPFDGAGEMNGYWSVPADVLEDTDALAAWAAKSVAVAARAKKPNAKKGRSR
jgi:DNA transformation protein and related proteins